jgi:hypothetical protein
MNTIKLTQEELDKISKLKKIDQELIWEIGQTETDIVILESKKEKLKQKFLTHLSEQNNFADELNKKYGIGKINLETGEFIPQ